jgi:hypothetical protein
MLTRMNKDLRRELGSRGPGLPWQFVVAGVSLTIGFIGLCNSLPAAYRVHVVSPTTDLAEPTTIDTEVLSQNPTIPELFAQAQPSPRANPSLIEPTDIVGAPAAGTAVAASAQVHAASDTSDGMPTTPTGSISLLASQPGSTAHAAPPASTPLLATATPTTAQPTPTAKAASPPGGRVMTYSTPTPARKGR